MESFVLKAKRAVKTVAAIGTGMAMLGATMTGAMALDLKDYPSPFVVNGKYSADNVLVVGAKAAASDTLGMVDIATNLQYESKECKPSSGGTISVAGGVAESIPIGAPIASDAPTKPTMFDQEIEDDDVDTLWDGEISFQSATYDTREVLYLGQAGKYTRVMSSLTSNDEDYKTDVVLETDKAAIKYYYAFDEAIALNATTSTNPLEIKFLGKTLKITNIGSDTKFSAYVGTEYFMDVGDSVEVEGKKVTLVNVGEGGSVVIDVDGVVEVVSSTAKTVNGIEVKVDSTFYETVKAQRSASLILGKEAQQTYKDDDAYTGEDKDNPNWKWVVANLNTEAKTELTTSGTTGPTLGVKNEFQWNDESDDPAGVGECIDLPNDYLSICLDSLTVADSSYATYEFKLEKDADLSQADGGSSSASTVYLKSSVDDGFSIKIGDGSLTAHNSTVSNTKSKEIWLWKCSNASTVDAESLGVYYRDNDNKKQLAGCLGSIDTSGYILDINYDNTKNGDIKVYAQNDADILQLVLVPYIATELTNFNDNITMNWTHDANSFSFTSLGASATSEEAGELVWTGYADNDPGNATSFTAINIGTKDDDLRSRYGIIIKDPKANGASDDVVLSIPADMVEANVVIRGSAASTTKAGEVCTVADITPVTKLDTEIAGSESSYNLILVGGPCANDAVEAVPGLGITCAGWSLKPGEGIIKLAANGNKVALLVAGTDALDTRRAAKVVANYKDYALSGTEALVKGTSLTDITVE
ncbi:MAG: S-layer protein [Candidatus Nanoarchaeia archaeon]